MLTLGIKAQLPHCTHPIQERGLSEKEKNEILALHNDLREKVLQGAIKGLPKAKYMKMLVWNTDLEKEAERYSKNSILEYYLVSDKSMPKSSFIPKSSFHF